EVGGARSGRQGHQGQGLDVVDTAVENQRLCNLLLVTLGLGHVLRHGEERLCKMINEGLVSAGAKLQEEALGNFGALLPELWWNPVPVHPPILPFAFLELVQIDA